MSVPSSRPDPPAVAYDVIAIAASAGGVEAVTAVLSRLPTDFPVPIVVVQHLSPRHKSLLATVLGRKTTLRVVQAGETDRIEPGKVLVAPPDRHVTIRPGGLVHLDEDAKVEHVRPSADVLFRSVAEAYGPRAVAVVLSGSGRDGARGAHEVHEAGGAVVVQDEATSDHFGMPGEAVRVGEVTAVLPLEEIAGALSRLVLEGTVD